MRAILENRCAPNFQSSPQLVSLLRSPRVFNLQAPDLHPQKSTHALKQLRTFPRLSTFPRPPQVPRASRKGRGGLASEFRVLLVPDRSAADWLAVGEPTEKFGRWQIFGLRFRTASALDVVFDANTIDLTPTRKLWVLENRKCLT